MYWLPLRVTPAGRGDVAERQRGHRPLQTVLLFLVQFLIKYRGQGFGVGGHPTNSYAFFWLVARILLKRIKNALQVTVAAMISLTGSARKTAKTLSCKIRAG